MEDSEIYLRALGIPYELTEQGIKLLGNNAGQTPQFTEYKGNIVVQGKR